MTTTPRHTRLFASRPNCRWTCHSAGLWLQVSIGAKQGPDSVEPGQQLSSGVTVAAAVRIGERMTRLDKPCLGNGSMWLTNAHETSSVQILGTSRYVCMVAVHTSWYMHRLGRPWVSRVYETPFNKQIGYQYEDSSCR